MVFQILRGNQLGHGFLVALQKFGIFFRLEINDAHFVVTNGVGGEIGENVFALILNFKREVGDVAAFLDFATLDDGHIATYRVGKKIQYLRRAALSRYQVGDFDTNFAPFFIFGAVYSAAWHAFALPAGWGVDSGGVLAGKNGADN